jgi:putative flippase GtrA
MAGVSLGSLLSFFLNRRFAFRQHGSPMGPQALRFALAMGSAMLVHSTFVGILVSRFALGLFASRLLADLCVFSVGLPLMLRHLVFTQQIPSLVPQSQATPRPLAPPP